MKIPRNYLQKLALPKQQEPCMTATVTMRPHQLSLYCKGNAHILMHFALSDYTCRASMHW